MNRKPNRILFVAAVASLSLTLGCEGSVGPAGEAGTAGAACWDLNADGIGDLATEDTNGDGAVTRLDCAGDDGPAAVDGHACWDLNGDGVGEASTEDTNGDGVVDVHDCYGGSCTVATDPGTGMSTISCDDGTTVTVPQGTSCDVESTGGTTTITCGDDTATVSDGTGGAPGVDGDSCVITEVAGGAQIDCADGTSVTINDGTSAGGEVNIFSTPEEVLAELVVTAEILDIDLDGDTPAVTFSYLDQYGRAIVGLEELRDSGEDRLVRFTMVKLVPGAADSGDPSQWVNFTKDEDDGHPTYEADGTFVYNGDGTYTYTFSTDVMNDGDVPWEPTLTHRLGGQVGDRDLPVMPVNFVYDFVPDGADVTETREIVDVASCNNCHDGIVFHGRRFETGYCVTCHNEGLAEGEAALAFMVHRIHSAGDFTTILDRGGDPVSFAEVTYPQDLENCRTCHDGVLPSTPQGNNWQDVPNEDACGGCHGDSTDWRDGGHFSVSNNEMCADCHGAEKIEEYHLTGNATPHNPMVPDDQRVIEYVLTSVSIAETGEPTIVFSVLSDGTALDVTDLPGDMLLPDRWPSFTMAYAMPQDGIEEPIDFNNLGNTAGQPTSVSLEAAVDGSAGSMTCTDGVCTAVLEYQFPDGAMLRNVGIQGYFRQDVDENGEYEYSLHAISVIGAPEGEERRTVVDSMACGSCHEWFEGHGGNRVYEMNICTVCHNPNLSSSGRSMDPASAIGSAADEYGMDTSTWPEDTQNFAAMVHGIHSADQRDSDFEHVRLVTFRDPPSGSLYNWSEVTFPAENGTSNCALCHDGDSFEVPLNANLLPTTVRTTSQADGDDGFADVADARDNVPNDTDWVTSPTAAACGYCHNSDAAEAHMEQNGAQIRVNRGDYDASEACAVCHGSGRDADVNVVHGLE